LRQQTRARRALLDWLRRLACRNSSLLRSLRGGNERNIAKSLADRFWADDGHSETAPLESGIVVPKRRRMGLVRRPLSDNQKRALP
jgi:hypothetical protein